MYYAMFNIVAKKTGAGTLQVTAPANRTRFVGVRLREADARRLEELADAVGVGVSTFARLVLEEYVAANPAKPTRRRKG